MPRAPLIMSAVLVLYAAALPVLGFMLTSFALVIVAARLMGLDGWWRRVRARARRHRGQPPALRHLAGGTAAVSDLFVALTPANLLACFAGVVLGTIVGVLPGLGPAGAIALLLPLTIKLGPTAGLIMLAAIYYGAMYGGSITTDPGQRPRRGGLRRHDHRRLSDGAAGPRRRRAGHRRDRVLHGGTVHAGPAQLAAPPLARIALSFGPPEFFALMVLGLALVVGLSGGALLTGLLSALQVLALGPGADLVDGTPRLTFGIPDLLDGISFVPVIMGLYGIGEILANLDERAAPTAPARLDSTMLTRQEWADSAMPIARGTGIGILLGLIPGIGTILPTIISYAVEKRVSRHPERFGRGAIEGVAGPETTNNAYANASMIPLFTLGVPASPTIAVLLGAFMMNGLTPGPFLFRERPDFVWGVIASLYVGNVILLILNLPLVGIFARVATIPLRYLMPAVLVLCAVAAYSDNNNAFDVWGWWAPACSRMRCAGSAMTRAARAPSRLGPLLERSLLQALTIGRGDVRELWSSGPAAVMLAWPWWRSWRRPSGPRPLGHALVPSVADRLSGGDWLPAEREVSCSPGSSCPWRPQRPEQNRRRVMAVYMVERDLKDIPMDQLAAAQKAAIDTGKKMTVSGKPVRYIRSTFVPAEGRCMCLFEAPQSTIASRS